MPNICSGAVYYAGIAMILAYLIYKYLKTTSMSEKMIYRDYILHIYRRGINIAAAIPPRSVNLWLNGSFFLKYCTTTYSQ